MCLRLFMLWPTWDKLAVHNTQALVRICGCGSPHKDRGRWVCSVKPLCIRQVVTMKANLKELSHLQIFTSELAEPGRGACSVSFLKWQLCCSVPCMKGLPVKPHDILAEGLGRRSQDWDVSGSLDTGVCLEPRAPFQCMQQWACGGRRTPARQWCWKPAHMASSHSFHPSQVSL